MLAMFLVTRDLDPKINGFPGLMVEHFYVKFGDPRCMVFLDIVQKNRQTNTEVKTLPHDYRRRG